MKNLNIKENILKHINDLHEDKIHEVLDFVLFLKQRQVDFSSEISSSREENRALLLEFGEGLFEGADVPNDTAAKHDNYLYGM